MALWQQYGQDAIGDAATLILHAIRDRLPEGFLVKVHAKALDGAKTPLVLSLERIFSDNRLLPALRRNPSAVLDVPTAEMLLSYVKPLPAKEVKSFHKRNSDAIRTLRLWNLEDKDMTWVLPTMELPNGGGLVSVLGAHMPKRPEIQPAADKLAKVIQRMGSGCGAQLHTMTCASWGKTALELRLTPEVLSVVLPAVEADTRPVLKPATSDLVMAHIKPLSKAALQTLMGCKDDIPWPVLMQPNCAGLLVSTAAGFPLGVGMMAAMPVERDKHSIPCQMLDQIEAAPTLKAARKAMGEEALLRELGLRRSITIGMHGEDKSKLSKYAATMLERFKLRCHACGSQAPGKPYQHCARCKLAAYCGKECQGADWKAHKAECKCAFALRVMFENARAGRAVEAAEVMVCMGMSRAEIDDALLSPATRDWARGLMAADPNMTMMSGCMAAGPSTPPQ